MDSTNDKWRRCATFVVLLIVFLLAQPLELHPRGEEVSDPYARDQVIRNGDLHHEVGILLLGVLAILTVRRLGFARFRPNTNLTMPITFFLSWACASMIWSDDPALTAKRVGALLIMAAGAAAIARSLSARDVLLLTFMTGILTVSVGMFFEIGLGAFHPFEADYRFWGILHPNFTGWDCSLCLIAIVALARKKLGVARCAYGLVFVVIAGFLLLTKSRGALGGALLGLLTYLILTSRPRRMLLLLFTSVPLYCLTMLFGGDSQGGGVLKFLLLGRGEDSTTLTGRTLFWQDYVLPQFLAHPITGYGYGAFWTAARYEKQISASGWFFPDAHNSFIEVALSLGIIGLCLYIIILAHAAYLSVRASRLSPLSIGPFSAAVIVCSAANGMLSSIQFDTYLGSFILFVVIAQITYGLAPLRCLIVRPAIHAADGCTSTERAADA